MSSHLLMFYMIPTIYGSFTAIIKTLDSIVIRPLTIFLVYG